MFSGVSCTPMIPPSFTVRVFFSEVADFSNTPTAYSVKKANRRERLAKITTSLGTATTAARTRSRSHPHSPLKDPGVPSLAFLEEENRSLEASYDPLRGSDDTPNQHHHQHSSQRETARERSHHHGLDLDAVKIGDGNDTQHDLERLRRASAPALTRHHASHRSNTTETSTEQLPTPSHNHPTPTHSIASERKPQEHADTTNDPATKKPSTPNAGADMLLLSDPPLVLHPPLMPVKNTNN